MVSPEIPGVARIAVHVAPDASPEVIEGLRHALETMPAVTSVTFQSHAESFEHFKVVFRDHPDIVANTKPWMLPQMFLLQLANNTDVQEVRLALQGQPGVVLVGLREPNPEA